VPTDATPCSPSLGPTASLRNGAYATVEMGTVAYDEESYRNAIGARPVVAHSGGACTVLVLVLARADSGVELLLHACPEMGRYSPPRGRGTGTGAYRGHSVASRYDRPCHRHLDDLCWSAPVRATEPTTRALGGRLGRGGRRRCQPAEGVEVALFLGGQLPGNAPVGMSYKILNTDRRIPVLGWFHPAKWRRLPSRLGVRTPCRRLLS
jgi:hypothetical protein